MTTTIGRGRPRRWATIWVLTAAAMVLATLGPWSTPVQAASASVGTAAHQPLFTDYFTVSPDPAWRFINRSGEVTGGRLVIDGGYLPGPRPSRDGWAMTHIGDTTWRDYRVSATYDSSNVGGTPAEAHMAMLYFRVVTSGATGAGTFYVVNVWDPGQPDPTGSTSGDLAQGLVQLFRLNHGQYTALSQRFFSASVTGSNKIRVSAKGARITVAVNGVRIFSVLDHHPIRHGGVGVGAIWETNTSFDDVVVRPI